MRPQDDDFFEFSVSFDYSGHDAFSDVATAIEAFSNAFAAYTRSKEARLHVTDFESGSLVCQLAANREAYLGIQVMAQDFGTLQHGSISPLIPERARQSLIKLLKHVEAVTLTLDEGAYTLGGAAASALVIPGADDFLRSTGHAGVLDRVDLRANQFRIMLPHGQRLTCTPALPFMAEISTALREATPRLKVFGTGKYHGPDFLPRSIQVRRVEVISPGPSLAALLDSFAALGTGDELIQKLSAEQARAEQMISQLNQVGD